MAGLTRGRGRTLRLVPLVAMATAALAVLGLSGPSSADVTAVQGSAYGYFASVSLFGGPANTRGPAPVVTLPPGGSAIPITAGAPSALVQFGPAILFSSGPITVSTQGTAGPAGFVTSTSNIENVNTSGQEVFTAANVSSTCTASEAGVSGSTTIVGGTLQVSEGDPNVDGDEVIVAIPANPAPNTVHAGQIETVGDRFRAVFNEQIVNADGSITVNAYHLYLLGPTAIGEVIVGHAVCAVAPTTTTVAPTTTTVAPTTTTVAPTTTTVCKPGWGFGDKNHCHFGPPGQLKKTNVAYINEDGGSGWSGLIVIFGAVLALFATARSGRQSN